MKAFDEHKYQQLFYTHFDKLICFYTKTWKNKKAYKGVFNI